MTASSRKLQKIKIIGSDHAGIAIGPILFVVAILAVLVAALAASGGFNGSTQTERDRVKASTVIEQGANFKAGFERLYGGALDVNEIILSTTYTDPNRDKALFSHAGGGLVQQSPAEGTVPTSGVTNWRFVAGANLSGIGIAAENDFTVVIGIKTANICKALNEIIFGKGAAAATTLPDASGATIVLNNADGCADTTVDTATSGCAVSANRFDISATAAVNGYSQACVDDGAGNYYYYQLLLAK